MTQQLSPSVCLRCVVGCALSALGRCHQHEGLPMPCITRQARKTLSVHGLVYPLVVFALVFSTIHGLPSRHKKASS
jgi:hypothetical protein